MNKVFWAFLVFITYAMADIQPGNQYVQVSLQTIEINGQLIAAVNYKNQPGWHTYWKNPGDSGLSLRNRFEINHKDETPEEYEWPTPHKFLEEGDILTFGLEGNYSLFYKVPKSWTNKPSVLHAGFLVCKNICVQGMYKLNFNIKNNKIDRNNDFEVDYDDMVTRFNQLPKVAKLPSNVEIYLNKGHKDKELLLYYIIKNVSAKPADDHQVLTPMLNPPLAQKKEELFFDKKNKTLYGKMIVEWEGEYQDPPQDLPKNGQFNQAIKANYLLWLPGSSAPTVLNHQFKNFSTGDAKKLDSFFLSINDDSSSGPTSSVDSSLLKMLLLALLGGMILNLMPCVLPVISLKLFGLIKHAHHGRAEILRQNLLYTFGVLFTLWILAIIIILLKQSGHVVGWGFQLQSPIFVFIMVSVLFIFALNMFGLFEFVTPGGRTLGGKHGGPFASGIISVILSTPCSAPFLGTALGFAFTTGSLNIFLIFTMIGLGLASPFIMTGLIPGMIKFLPRPGIWMEKLKYFLGLALLLTMIWLIDLLMGQLDAASITRLMSVHLLVLFFSIFAYKKVAVQIWSRLFFVLIPLAWSGYVIANSKDHFAPKVSVGNIAAHSQWSPWSPEKMNELKGKVVFVDFTADWCLTCKVNKKLVLETESFLTFAQSQKIELLRADWTNRDEVIGKWLEQYKIVGIPAYFLQLPNGEIKFLGETVSIEKIQQAL